MSKEEKFNYYVIFEMLPQTWIFSALKPEMEFKEFKPRFKSAKTRFKLSAGLNLETFDTILSGTNHDLSRGLNINRRSNSLNSATGGMNLFGKDFKKVSYKSFF